MQTTTLDSTLMPAGVLAAASRLAGRVLIGGVFVLAGWQKMFSYAGTQGYMDAMGVPGGMLPLVIALELGVGLALIAGWQTRWAALLLAGFTALASIVFHSSFVDPNQAIFLMKNVMVIGGLLTLAAAGAGAWSLDQRRAG